MKYTRELKFEEKPDYNWIKGQFRNLLYRMDFTIDYVFDWSRLNSVRQAGSPSVPNSPPLEQHPQTAAATAATEERRRKRRNR